MRLEKRIMGGLSTVYYHQFMAYVVCYDLNCNIDPPPLLLVAISNVARLPPVAEKAAEGDIYTSFQFTLILYYIVKISCGTSQPLQEAGVCLQLLAEMARKCRHAGNLIHNYTSEVQVVIRTTVGLLRQAIRGYEWDINIPVNVDETSDTDIDTDTDIDFAEDISGTVQEEPKVAKENMYYRPSYFIL